MFVLHIRTLIALKLAVHNNIGCLNSWLHGCISGQEKKVYCDQQDSESEASLGSIYTTLVTCPFRIRDVRTG